jgi:hypothetical protein
MQPHLSRVQTLVSPLPVKVANGQVLSSTHHIPTTSWNRSSCKFVADLKFLTLPYFDLVIGKYCILSRQPPWPPLVQFVIHGGIEQGYIWRVEGLLFQAAINEDDCNGIIQFIQLHYDLFDKILWSASYTSDMYYNCRDCAWFKVMWQANTCLLPWFQGHKSASTMPLHAIDEAWELLTLEDGVKTVPEQTRQLMRALSLSLVAWEGTDTGTAMRLSGCMQQQDPLILMDSGSSHTSVNGHLCIQKLPLSIPVQVANSQCSLTHVEWTNKRIVIPYKCSSVWLQGLPPSWPTGELITKLIHQQLSRTSSR